MTWFVQLDPLPQSAANIRTAGTMCPSMDWLPVWGVFQKMDGWTTNLAADADTENKI